MSTKVRVIKKSGRKHFVLRYTDPRTGRECQVSAKTSVRREAEKQAGELEAKLREGRHQPTLRISWEAFRERCEAEKLAGMAEQSQRSYCGTLNKVEALMNPRRLEEVDAAFVSTLHARLRETGIRDASIARHLRALKAMTRWAESLGLMAKAPKVHFPTRARGERVMKGRPISAEEFGRMLEATPQVVGEVAAPSWIYYLEGMWRSGLRLTESLSLSWDANAGIGVDLSGRYPMLNIRAECEKGNRDRLLPMAPDFAEFLEATPENERRGRVFKFHDGRGKPVEYERYHVCKTVVRIGKAAGVIVDDRGKGKHASLHDLRRSFGARWAERVMPNVLQMLMRHDTYLTTQKYYVGQDADRAAATLWQSVGKDPRNGGYGGPALEEEPDSSSENPRG